VKPRFALTTAQSVIVVGVPGPAVGLLVAPGVCVGVAVPVAVAVGVAVPVAVAVGVAVPVAVAVGVGVTAPSSRKTISGFAHQPMRLRGRVEGVGVGAELPPNRPEQALKSMLIKIRLAAR